MYRFVAGDGENPRDVNRLAYLNLCMVRPS